LHKKVQLLQLVQNEQLKMQRLQLLPGRSAFLCKRNKNLKTMKKLFLSAITISTIITTTAQQGSLDPSFADNAELKIINFLEPGEEWMQHVVVDNQDKIWLAGETILNSDWALILARLTADGEYDTDFGLGGYGVINIANNNIEKIGGITLFDNDLIIAGHKIAGGNTNQFVIKYTEDGFLDTSFGSLGLADLPFQATATGVTTDAAGNIYISGVFFGDVTVTKLLPNGTPDPDFGLAGITLADFPSEDQSTSIQLDESGNIFVFGQGELNGIVRGQITSFLPTGAPNTSFTANSRKSITWPNDKEFYVSDGILSLDGTHFFLGGHTVNAVSGELNAAMVAVNVNSNQNMNFGLNGWFELDASIGGDELIHRVVQDANGLYLTMVVQEVPVGINSVVAHISTNGVPIEAFGNGGIADYNIVPFGNDQALDLAFQSNGNLILCGLLLGDGVSSYAARIITASPTGISEMNKYAEIKLFPNPAVNNLWVSVNDLDSNGESYRIITANGHLVQQGKIESSQQNIDVSALAQGYYLLMVGDENHAYFIKTN
jgi:uncharacterized delta-60 repeat protein